jgi:hypothetical protein
MKVYKDATAAKKLVQLHEFIELLPPNFRAGGPFHLKKGLIVPCQKKGAPYPRATH